MLGPPQVGIPGHSATSGFSSYVKYPFHLQLTFQSPGQGDPQDNAGELSLLEESPASTYTIHFLVPLCPAAPYNQQAAEPDSLTPDTSLTPTSCDRESPVPPSSFLFNGGDSRTHSTWWL